MRIYILEVETGVFDGKTQETGTHFKIFMNLNYDTAYNKTYSMGAFGQVRALYDMIDKSLFFWDSELGLHVDGMAALGREDNIIPFYLYRFSKGEQTQNQVQMDYDMYTRFYGGEMEKEEVEELLINSLTLKRFFKGEPYQVGVIF
ncbi:MAG TPA: hypothetical protein ENI23_01480 [bacterium]|nr:hypothetical protein [bacterium]